MEPAGVLLSSKNVNIAFVSRTLVELQKCLTCIGGRPTWKRFLHNPHVSVVRRGLDLYIQKITVLSRNSFARRSRGNNLSPTFTKMLW